MLFKLFTLKKQHRIKSNFILSAYFCVFFIGERRLRKGQLSEDMPIEVLHCVSAPNFHIYVLFSFFHVEGNSAVVF